MMILRKAPLPRERGSRNSFISVQQLAGKKGKGGPEQVFYPGPAWVPEPQKTFEL